MIKFFRCLRENYYFIGKSLSLSNSGYIGDFFYWCLIKDSHIGFRSPFRGFRFAQPPAIESLSLSGASHPTPSECSRYVIGTTSDVRRISTGNIVSFLSVRVFADAVSVGFAFRGFRFAQPPVIESLRSPVRRTQHSRRYRQYVGGMPSENRVGLSSEVPFPRVSLRSPVLRTLYSRIPHHTNAVGM